MRKWKNQGSVAIYLAVTILIIGVLGAGGIFIKKELAKNELRREEQVRLLAEQTQRLQEEENARQEAERSARLAREQRQKDEQALRDAEIQRLQEVIATKQQPQNTPAQTTPTQNTSSRTTLTQEEYDARRRGTNAAAVPNIRIAESVRLAQNQRPNSTTARTNASSSTTVWRCQRCGMEERTNSSSTKPPGAICKNAPEISGRAVHSRTPTSQRTRLPHDWRVLRTSSPTQARSTSGYQQIYDEYSRKIRNAAPNSSINRLAEITNEGVSKMAQYMLSASGTDGQYATYESWANRLTDVYMREAR